jgi:hypothetical protein
MMSFDGIIGSTAATEPTRVDLYPSHSLLEPSSAFTAKILSLDDELQTALICQAEILQVLEAAKSGKQRGTTTTAAYFVEDGLDVEGDIDGEDLRLAKLTRLSDEEL